MEDMELADTLFMKREKIDLNVDQNFIDSAISYLLSYISTFCCKT